MPSGATPGVQLYTDATQDAALKNQVRCAYVKSANTANLFGDPSALDPRQDTAIIGGATPIFTTTDYQDGDTAATATVMKLVIDGFAGAGTIALGGYDYHDGTRATGETRNFKAGQMIGAVLEYAARRKGTPVMIYVLSGRLAQFQQHGGQQYRRARQARLAGRQLLRRVDLLPGVQPEGAPGGCATAPPASRSATSAPTARW